MLVKALKATLILPARIAVLPFRLTMLTLNKVAQKESETVRADIGSLLKTVPRHPLYSSWVSRSALTVATRPDLFTFDHSSFLNSGQTGLVGEFCQGSWRPFLTKLYNTKMVGTGRSSCDQDCSKETNSNRSNTIRLSGCLQTLSLTVFPPSNLGSVVLSHHPLGCFFPIKQGRFQYLNFSSRPIRPAPVAIINSCSSQLSSAVLVKKSCGCNTAEFLSREWCRLLVSIVMLTRLTHLLLYAARIKHLLLFVSMTSLFSTKNDLIEVLDQHFPRATRSDLPKEKPGTSTVLAHLPCRNSDHAEEGCAENYEVSQIYSKPGKQDKASNPVSEEADKAKSVQVDHETAVSGRKRKREKEEKENVRRSTLMLERA